MTPSTSAGHLMARSLSHGGIAGAVVGSVIGGTIIFLLVLPFILRAIRERRYRKEIAQENAEMGMAGSGFYNGPGQPYRPPYFQPAASGADSGVGGPATQASADATATVGGNNSSEDGKTFQSPPSPSVPAIKASEASEMPAVIDAPAASPTVPSPVAQAFVAEPTAAADPGPVPTARSAFPVGSAPINTNDPQPQQFLRKQDQRWPTTPPTLNSAATFPIFGTQDPTFTPRQRSSTMRSARQSSLSHTLEGFAGRAASIFRQGSTRSTPTRSSTNRSSRAPTELARSPVEISFDHLDPINHHTWLMRQQGIDDHSTGVDPSFFEVSTQYLTGASAEYYSGAPLSPPTDPNSSFMAPISYAASPPSMIATSLATMASTAGIAGVASGSKKQPKPIAARTDSLRTIPSGTEFSPLPLSPTSPLPKVLEGTDSGGSNKEARDKPDAVEGETTSRELSSPPTSTVSARGGLTPDPVEFMPRSPSYRPLVPSPQLPAPGTVNPRDVWAPATEDERFVHKTAELDRIEQSPQPISSGQPSPAIAADTSFLASPFSPDKYTADSEMNEDCGTKQEDASTAVVSPAQPTNFEASPDEDKELAVNTPVQPTTEVSGTASPEIEIKADPDIVADTADDTADDITESSTSQSEEAQASAIKDDIQIDADARQADFAMLQDLLLADDFQGGINFAYGDSVQYGYMPEMNNNTYQLGGNDEMSDLPTIPQQTGTMYWPAPNNIPHNGPNTMPTTMPTTMPNNIPTISGPYMTPVIQGSYSNGIGSVNGMGGMQGLNYGNDMSTSQYSSQTPQSSPSQPPGPQTNGNMSQYPAPSNVAMPMTPSPSKPIANFNSPLLVPGYEGLKGPVSPLSNQGSTPGQASSTSPRAHACDECGRVFDQIHKLNHHKRYHERPHECVVAGCGKRFGTKTHLDRHINDKHSKSRKYHCTEDGCPYSLPRGKSFPRKDNWRRHMVNKHGVHPEHEPIEVIDQPMISV